MRVKELKLHNFRGIKDLHLLFNPKHNIIVLVGVNGVGKSSILDCLKALIDFHKIVYDGIDTISEHFLMFHHQQDQQNFLHDRESLLSISDIHLDASNTLNQIKVQFNNRDLEWKIAKFKHDNDNRLWKEIYDKSRDSIAASQDIRHKPQGAEITNKEPLINSCFYYLSSRQVLDLMTYAHRRSEYIINFEDFSTWFKEIESLENEQRLADDMDYQHPVLAAVRKATYLLLGEGYDRLRFKRAIDKMTIRKSGREISLELLSDGEKSLLAMVGHLSRKLAEYNPDLINPLEASAIVLIDEIELHLHPAWQRMIIPRLTQTFPNCQFIVTTHSPQVLSHVDPECIHILDYDGDNVVVKRPDSSYGLDSNRILEDILGVSKRPQEIQDRMSELFRTINNNDLEGAKEIVRELGDKIGISEPELVKAEATIKRREIIGR
jgi:predicted ATP-binding protein involved in virulence